MANQSVFHEINNWGATHLTALCVLPGYRRDAPEPRNAELRQYGTLLSEHYRYCRCFCVRLILRDRDYERLPKFGTTQPYYRYSQWNKTTEVWRPRVAKLAKPPEVATVDGDGTGWSLMSLTMKQHETPENMEQQQLAQPSASFIPVEIVSVDVRWQMWRGTAKVVAGRVNSEVYRRKEPIPMDFYGFLLHLFLNGFSHIHHILLPRSIWECSVTYPTCNFAPGGSLPSVRNTNRTDAAHEK